MKKIFILIILIGCLFITSCKEKTTVVNNVINQTVDIEDKITIDEFEEVLCNVVENVENSVVGIKCVSNNSFLKTESYGSGVVIKKENNKYYIVTNRHVIMKQGSVYSDIDIYLGNIDLYVDALVVSYDEKIDLALLEIETEILLKAVAINSNIKKGQYSISIGSPYQLETYYNTVSIGNVSGLNRVIVEDTYFHKNISNEYIQTTSIINVGCSGGGIFNLKGELIGINTWKLIDSANQIEGMSFGISSKYIIELFSDYLDN